MVTAGLGVLILLLGFTPVVKSTGYRGSTANFFETGNVAPLALLLVAGLIAGVGLLPEQSKLTGVAAAVAVGGFLCLVLQTIAFGISDGAGPAWGSYLELFLGLVLTAAAVGAMLIDAGIISPSASNSTAQRGFGQYGQSGAGQSGAGQSGAAPYGQRTSSSYGPPAPSQYGQGQGQFGAPQGSSDQPGSYGQGASVTQSQPGSGYYGAAEPQQSYGQPPQQPSYGQAPSYGQPQRYGQQPQGQSYGQQPQEEQSYGQPSQEQSHGQQPSPEQGESAGSYSPSTQAFGSHAVEDETTVHPRENPYGPPHQQ